MLSALDIIYIEEIFKEEKEKEENHCLYPIETKEECLEEEEY